MFDLLQSAMCEVSELAGAEHRAPPSAATSPRIEEGGASLGASLGDLGRGLADEGVSALLDPMGAIDRQQASRQLADRFEIVDPSAAGPRLPNQVSADEYDEVVRTFSDIRRGNSDIRFDPSERSCSDPQVFEDAMMSDIANIMQTPSGRDLVESLHDNKGPDEHGDVVSRTTTLSPRFDGGVENSDNAETINRDALHTFGLRQRDGSPGRGSTDVEIELNPGATVSDVPGGSQIRSDVALYHEMVHAHDMTHGLVDVNQVEEGDQMMGKLISGDFGGAWDGLFERDYQTMWDSRQLVGRDEHAAAGLGLYQGRWLSENTYRAERNQVADSGLGRGGDADMVQRNRYDSFSPDLL